MLPRRQMKCPSRKVCQRLPHANVEKHDVRMGHLPIYIVGKGLPDGCKALQGLQELSFLTSFDLQATLHVVVYGLGELAPSLITDSVIPPPKIASRNSSSLG